MTGPDVMFPEEQQQMSMVCARLARDANAKAVLLIGRDGQPIADAGDVDELDVTSLSSLTAGNVAATGGRAVRAERPEPQRLNVVLRRIVEAPARDLARRESECCSFFTFEFESVGDDVVMRIGVPPEHVEVLDALEARTTST